MDEIFFLLKARLDNAGVDFFLKDKLEVIVGIELFVADEIKVIEGTDEGDPEILEFLIDSLFEVS